MGIEGIFNSLSKNDTIKTSDGIVIGITKKIDCNYLHVDFTSILYLISNNIDKELAYLLYSIIINEFLVDKKSIGISSKWNYPIDTASVFTYKKHFTSELIESYIKDEVQTYIVFMITKLVTNNELKFIQFAMDGVPQMSKIIEQKKRRYMGTVVSELKKHISSKYYSKLKQFDNSDLNIKKISSNREIYEKYKVSCDRGRFLASTEMMESIGKLLTSDAFYNQIKSICPSLENMTVSTNNEVGEGEKKIVEHILLNKNKGKYVIYSPDGDLVILCLIMFNILSREDTNPGSNSTQMTILRYNQQSEQYDTIDINILNTNMFTYVKSICDKYKPVNLSMDNIGFDLAILFTLFGNDFIPKIESINVRNDMIKIIEYYCQILVDSITNSKPNYFVSYNTNTKEYNISPLYIYKLFEKISKDEEQLLQGTYLSNLKNYKYLKNILGEGLMSQLIQEYITNANQVYKLLCTTDKNTITANTHNKIGLKFMKQFICLESRTRENFSQIARMDEKKTKDKFLSILNSITGIDQTTKQLFIKKPKLMFNIAEKTVENEYHLENIKKHLPHPRINITEYDKDLYKLDNMMDEWAVKFNTNKCNTLGMVNLYVNSSSGATGHPVHPAHPAQPISHTYKYVPYRKFTNEMYIYYYNYFNIDTNTLNGSKQIDTLVQDYLRGITWVFDFYFNKNVSNINSSIIPTWVYPHHRAPLATQIYEHMKKKGGLNKSQYYSKISEYITTQCYDIICL